MKTLAERARHARKSAGLTQEEAGKAVGISTSAIGQWESGKSKTINSEHLHIAARAYGVSPEWLATGKKAPGAAGSDVNPRLTALHAIVAPMSDDQLDFALQMLRAIPPDTKKKKAKKKR